MPGLKRHSVGTVTSPATGLCAHSVFYFRSCSGWSASTPSLIGELAVAKLLDRFQPAGETKLPQWWRFVRESPSVEGILFNKEERERITESPEAMAEHAVQRVLWSFDSPQRLWDAYKGLSGMEEKFPSDVRPFANRLTQVWGEIYYGMDQARRDLAPKSRRKNK